MQNIHYTNFTLLRKNKKVTIAFLSFYFSSKMLLIFYWVGGSGVGDFATHWVTTSGGATFQTNTPTAANVFSLS
jgi:hypothetical protein